MSLEYLPLEVFQVILHSLTKKDFLSLCPTSKRLLLFSRPPLFTSISLDVSSIWFHEQSEDFDAGPWAQRKRDSFFRAIQATPSLTVNIQSLYLSIDPHCLTTSALQKIEFILVHSSRLRRLTLSRPPGGGQGNVPREILRAVPRTVKSVTIRYRPLSVEGIHFLLARLDKGIEIDLSMCDPLPLPTGTLDPIDTVTTLTLSHADADWSPFIAVFIPALASFSKLTGPFVSLPTLKSLSTQQTWHLTVLQLTGTLIRSNLSHASSQTSYTENPISFLTDLAALLQNTPRLRVLVIHVAYCYPFYPPPLHSYSLLEHLPKSLRRLHLKAPDIVPIKSVLPYLGSPTSSMNLRYLALCLDTLGSQDHEALSCRKSVEDQAEELCKDRGIELRWLEWP